MVADTEARILKRIIVPDPDELPAEAAAYVLTLDFSDEDHRRMEELMAKSRAGTLAPAENQELESYIQVGHFLTTLQSKARRVLGA